MKKLMVEVTIYLKCGITLHQRWSPDDWRAYAEKKHRFVYEAVATNMVSV